MSAMGNQKALVFSPKCSCSPPYLRTALPLVIHSHFAGLTLLPVLAARLEVARDGDIEEGGGDRERRTETEGERQIEINSEEGKWVSVRWKGERGPTEIRSAELSRKSRSTKTHAGPHTYIP